MMKLRKKIIPEIITDYKIPIVVVRFDHTYSVSVNFWVKRGAINDFAGKEGLAHFLEHIVFKGGMKYDGEEIVKTIESTGGHINAMSSKEYTTFYIKVLEDDFEQSFDMLADIVLSPRFSEEDFIKEKKVVLEEINSYLDSPDELVHELFSEFLWQDHVLGKPILGYKDTVEKITPQDLMNFHKANYAQDTIFITISGNVTDEMIKFIGKIVDEKDIPQKAIDYNIASPIVVKEKEKIINKGTEQAHVCIGRDAASYFEEERYAINLFNVLLGSGMSSYLFKYLREELGLAYSVYSYYSPYKIAGEFVIYFGTKSNYYNDALNVVKKILEAMNTIDENDLQQAKKMIIGSMFLKLENPASVASSISRDLIIFNKIRDFQEMFDKVNSISLKEVKNAIEKYLDWNNLKIVAIK